MCLKMFKNAFKCNKTKQSKYSRWSTRINQVDSWCRCMANLGVDLSQKAAISSAVGSTRAG